MGALRPHARRLPPVRARRDGRCGAAPVRRQPDPRLRNLELSRRRRSAAFHTRAQKSRGAARGAPAETGGASRRSQAARAGGGARAQGRGACEEAGGEGKAEERQGRKGRQGRKAREAREAREEEEEIADSE